LPAASIAANSDVSLICQIGDCACRFAALAHAGFIMRGDDDRDLQAAARESELKLQAGHLGHLQIGDQASFNLAAVGRAVQARPFSPSAAENQAFNNAIACSYEGLSRRKKFRRATVTAVFISGWAARRYHADVAFPDLTLIDP
jgi:hypothetical protein